MHQGLKWLLALAIVFSGFVLMLIPQYGMAPYWGQGWGERVPPSWRGGIGWRGGGFGDDMMRGSIGAWRAPGPDLGYGVEMMGGGDWPAALSSQQRVRVGQIQAKALRAEGALQAQLYAARANLLVLNSAVSPDSSELSKARDDVVENLRRIVQIRVQAAQQIQAALITPAAPSKAASAPAISP